MDFGGIDYLLDEDRFDRQFNALSSRFEPFDFNWRVWQPFEDLNYFLDRDYS